MQFFERRLNVTVVLYSHVDSLATKFPEEILLAAREIAAWVAMIDPSVCENGAGCRAETSGCR